MYNGALADMSLGGDHYTSNRYAFTAGNPITRVEYDGHRPIDCMEEHYSCTKTGESWTVVNEYDHMTLEEIMGQELLDSFEADGHDELLRRNRDAAPDDTGETSIFDGVGDQLHETFLTAEGLAGWTDDASEVTGIAALFGLGLEGSGLLIGVASAPTGAGPFVGGAMVAVGGWVSTVSGYATVALDTTNAIANARLGNTDEAVDSAVSAGVGLFMPGAGFAADKMAGYFGEGAPWVVDVMLEIGGRGIEDGIQNAFDR